MNPSQSSELESAASALSEGMNILAVLASPKLLAQAIGGRAFRTQAEAYLEECVELLAKPGLSFPTEFRLDEMKAGISSASTLLEGWDGALPPPEALLLAARSALAATGVPAPPEGWDAFDGLPQG
jgi:hypothetical protein